MQWWIFTQSCKMILTFTVLLLRWLPNERFGVPWFFSGAAYFFWAFLPQCHPHQLAKSHAFKGFILWVFCPSQNFSYTQDSAPKINLIRCAGRGWCFYFIFQFIRKYSLFWLETFQVVGCFICLFFAAILGTRITPKTRLVSGSPTKQHRQPTVATSFILFLVFPPFLWKVQLLAPK